MRSACWIVSILILIFVLGVCFSFYAHKSWRDYLVAEKHKKWDEARKATQLLIRNAGTIGLTDGELNAYSEVLISMGGLPASRSKDGVISATVTSERPVGYWDYLSDIVFKDNRHVWLLSIEVRREDGGSWAGTFQEGEGQAYPGTVQ